MIDWAIFWGIMAFWPILLFFICVIERRWPWAVLREDWRVTKAIPLWRSF